MNWISKAGALTLALGIGLSAGCAKKPAGEGADAGGDKAAATAKIDINTAPYEELEKLELPGTEPGLDHRIIDNRPYDSIEDLLTKKVASQKEFDLVKDLITVNTPGEAAPEGADEYEEEEGEEASAEGEEGAEGETAETGEAGAGETDAGAGEGEAAPAEGEGAGE